MIPYFYFRSTTVLTVSSAELHEMTPTGRSAIAGRQDAIASLEIWVIGAAAIIGVIGLLLLVTGALRLKSAQEREDEESDLKQRRARLEFEEMSPAEKEEKDTERAAVEVEEEGESPAPVPRAEGEPAVTRSGTSFFRAWRRRTAVIRRISTEVEKTFRGREIGPYNFKWQVRVGSSNEEVRLDGVFEATDARYRDVVLRIRVTPDPSILSKTAHSTSDDLIATLGRYEKLAGRRANGWIVAVIPSDAERKAAQVELEGAESLRKAIGTWGEVTLVDEDEIEELPAIFAQLFGSS